MSKYTLKSIAQRGSLIGVVAGLLVATVYPSLTFADALNPLTDRSLTLSSSSPGWSFTDGSGNPTYAAPNTGANGKKTGNTFSFKVSTNSTNTGTNEPIKAYTFQYCTLSAGMCFSPGNNGYSGSSSPYTRNSDSVSAKTSDLNVVTNSPSEISSGTFSSIINTSTGNTVGTNTVSTLGNAQTGVPARDDSEGNFVVLTKNTGAGSWSQSTGWTMDAANVEDGDPDDGVTSDGSATGANNMITIKNSTGVGLLAGADVKVIFFGTDGNYITNPGAGAFFVKINNYKSDTTLDNTTLVDGGVTVANVMNQSIEIQTKVLETMDFSVGTVDPYTLDHTQLLASPLAAGTHGQCDPIMTAFTAANAALTPNVIQIGDQSAENSLSTSKTYSGHSYWRLSSNSSAGATIYYSGTTLKNTVGDQINPIGTTSAAPSRGTPQFGLAIANSTSGNRAVDYSKEVTSGQVYENGADNAVAGVHASVAADVASLTGYHAPQLAPLVPETGYDKGAGVVNNEYGTVNTEFAFDPNANNVPTPLASESSSVVDCVTAKIRYIANIAATTPAGIYTTKINYIAAPQY